MVDTELVVVYNRATIEVFAKQSSRGSTVKVRRNSHYGYSPNAYPSASAKRFSGKCRRRGGAGATEPPGSREAF